MSRDILIENGTIIDGTGAAPRPGSVLVSADRITATGAQADEHARSVNDLERIDATGMTVMPGLIDAHCHISFDEVSSNDELFFHRSRPALAAIIAARNVRKLLRAGVTGFLDPDSIHELGIDLRDAIEAGVIEGPRMATGGYALMTAVGGTAGRLVPDEGIIGYARIVRTKDEITSEVRRQIKGGVDWIKVHVTGLIPRQLHRGELQVWSFDELKLVCDVAHDLGIPVMGHCRGPQSTRDAARAGFDLILHATLMDEPALEAVVARKVALVPTLTFQANLIDYGAKLGADPFLQDLFRREIADSAETLRRAHKAGVPLLCGSESGFSVTPYGEWHWKELEVFVRDFGMTPLEALRCATLEGARALKLDGKTGEIAADRLADIIVVDGDPSRDVGVLGRPDAVRMVFVGGKRIDLTQEPPPRRPISGWRVNSYGQILSRDVAR